MVHPCPHGSVGPSTGPQPQALSAGDHGHPTQTLRPNTVLPPLGSPASLHVRRPRSASPGVSCGTQNSKGPKLGSCPPLIPQTCRPQHPQGVAMASCPASRLGGVTLDLSSSSCSQAQVLGLPPLVRLSIFPRAGRQIPPPILPGARELVSRGSRPLQTVVHTLRPTSRWGSRSTPFLKHFPSPPPPPHCGTPFPILLPWPFGITWHLIRDCVPCHHPPDPLSTCQDVASSRKTALTSEKAPGPLLSRPAVRISWSFRPPLRSRLFSGLSALEAPQGVGLSAFPGEGTPVGTVVTWWFTATGI
ncbi:uncharacterized protein LOC125090218 isoform X2 [Lutra lutra]|uniref:uncharacterized protein LOC125090218 isoform X2 n=1 Tax=Lutra lutra TaxID=9657 RepID=UPI001FD3920D|nr:uncharacterized protein LOC125090218 isoform X2 [Lutra lutra]